MHHRITPRRNSIATPDCCTRVSLDYVLAGARGRRREFPDVTSFAPKFPPTLHVLVSFFKFSQVPDALVPPGCFVVLHCDHQFPMAPLPFPRAPQPQSQSVVLVVAAAVVVSLLFYSGSIATAAAARVVGEMVVHFFFP